MSGFALLRAAASGGGRGGGVPGGSCVEGDAGAEAEAETAEMIIENNHDQEDSMETMPQVVDDEAAEDLARKQSKYSEELDAAGEIGDREEEGPRPEVHVVVIRNPSERLRDYIRALKLEALIEDPAALLAKFPEPAALFRRLRSKYGTGPGIMDLQVEHCPTHAETSSLLLTLQCHVTQTLTV